MALSAQHGGPYYFTVDKMKKSLILFLLTTLVGCTSNHLVQRLSDNPITLDRSKLIYVAEPVDGGYADKDGGYADKATRSGSGQEVAESLVKALSAQGIPVQYGDKPEDTAHAIAAARALHAAYVAVPVLDNWEQRTTMWSGLPSRISIQMSVIDINTGEEVDDTILDALSPYMVVGTTRPARLLPATMADYVQTLYGLPALKSPTAQP